MANPVIPTSYSKGTIRIKTKEEDAMRDTVLEYTDSSTSRDAFDDAMRGFLVAPSFSTKQRALDLLLSKICREGVPRESPAP